MEHFMFYQSFRCDVKQKQERTTSTSRVDYELFYPNPKTKRTNLINMQLNFQKGEKKKKQLKPPP